MQKYELLYIITSSISEEEVDNVAKKVEALIAKNNATITSSEKLGLKKFAYPIQFRNDGYYFLVNMEAEQEAPKSISKQLNIMDGVVRHMFVAK